MKPKTLLLVVALLAVASVLVYLLQRPSSARPADPRVGQPLLDASVVEQATHVRLTHEGQTVELERQADDSWLVVSYHRLPADFAKLSRFIQDLTEARVERLVTTNPRLIDRLEFNDTSLALSEPGGSSLWSVDLGKNADGGGRFVRFGEEERAYLTRFSAWLDASPRNWADTALLAVKPEEIASLTIEFPEGDGGPLVLSRESADQPFTAAGGPEGRTLRETSVTSLLTTLSNLHFTETTTPDAPDVAAAREHLRTFRLETFTGGDVTVALGRRPERTVVTTAGDESRGPASLANPTDEAAEPESGPATAAGTATETQPAGPVYAFIDGEPGLVRLAHAADELAFRVSDYSFTSLPATRDALFEPAPSAAPPAEEPAESQEPDAPAGQQ